MKRKSSAPTMKDVAREAGVALGTVSKVFNGIPVGESYRLRVEQAAAKLGYQVNSYARGLKANKTGTVALILPNAYDPFFAALADNICQALARRGCRMLLTVTGSDPACPAWPPTTSAAASWRRKSSWSWGAKSSSSSASARTCPASRTSA